MSCEYCGTPVYHYEGRWLHAVKGDYDYDHPPTPEGSLPVPRRKSVTAAKEALAICRRLYPWRVREAEQAKKDQRRETRQAVPIYVTITREGYKVSALPQTE